ncbi:MAG TPA: transposase [Frankiaceae bacterium]|nr:transposase [Frankiaceae bacterium]
MSDAHAAPFYCPYCGEEDLEPEGEHGGWACRACLRAFQLRFAGVRATPGEQGAPAPHR